MVIYEKENKLNINFENSMQGTPDLQISKEDGKTSVTVDGQPGGGESNIMLVGLSIDSVSGDEVLDKTWKEIHDALMSGTPVYLKYQEGESYSAVWPVLCAYTVNGSYGVEFVYHSDAPMHLIFTASSENDYPMYKNK